MPVNQTTSSMAIGIGSMARATRVSTGDLVTERILGLRDSRILGREKGYSSILRVNDN